MRLRSATLVSLTASLCSRAASLRRHFGVRSSSDSPFMEVSPSYRTASPQGGITSHPALSLALGHMEEQSRIPDFERAFWAVRYVDDVFSVAGGLCPACVERTIQHVYGTLFTRAGEKDGWTTWLDQEFRVVGDAVVRRFRHGAREWVAGRALRPDRPTFLPYLGALPSSFAVIRGIVCGRLKRLRTLQCGGAEIVQVLLETHLELVLLGYPVSFVRAVAQSLSKSPAVYTVCAAIRALDMPARRSSAHTRHGARQAAPYAPRERGAERRRGRRGGKREWAASSSSSSSGSEGDRAYKAEKARERRKLGYRAQGATLAAALDERFATLTAALAGPTASASAASAPASVLQTWPHGLTYPPQFPPGPAQPPPYPQPAPPAPTMAQTLSSSDELVRALLARSSARLPNSPRERRRAAQAPRTRRRRARPSPPRRCCRRSSPQRARARPAPQVDASPSFSAACCQRHSAGSVHCRRACPSMPSRARSWPH